MTALAREILNFFEKLPDSERYEVAVEILRQLVDSDSSPLTDEDLVVNAEALFLELDREEGDDE